MSAAKEVQIDHVSRPLRWLTEAVLLVSSLLILVPLWMVVINSLKTRREANLFGILPPDKLEWSNYAIVFEDGSVVRSFFNGLFMSTVSCVLIVLMAMMAAFVIGRRRSRMSEFMYYLLVAGLIVPAALVPTYWILSSLNLIGTFAGVILIYIATCLPFSVFLYTGFIKTVPRELDEAAIMDGSGQLRLLFGLIFPLLKPVTMTVVVINFISTWNEVNNQLFFLNSKHWSMPMTVYKFFGEYTQDWNLVFADILITILPLLAIYLLAQRFIVSGLTAGAVKG
ncbi:carbohydrate ABC transporter permease [Cohnella cellulosilytica]|uniref:Carbohydrate ABC transporter permease n=1 Tax=Cohnella cellulosilytica TaxID=986710 RepID=A0ABW2F7A0_9BACL